MGHIMLIRLCGQVGGMVYRSFKLNTGYQQETYLLICFLLFVFGIAWGMIPRTGPKDELLRLRANVPGLLGTKRVPL